MADGDGAPAPRIGILISAAWNSTLQAVRAMPALFGCAALLSMAVSFAGILSEDGTGELVGMVGSTAAGIMSGITGIFLLVLNAWVLAPVAVAVHRMVLLNEVTPGLIAWSHRRIWHFAGWTLLLELVASALALPMLASRETGLEVVALIAFVALMAVIAVRGLMIFPAVALEAPSAGVSQRIQASLDQTRGHFWRLALALTGTLLLLILPVMLVGIILIFATSSGGSSEMHYGVRAGMALLNAALEPIGIGLGAALASWFYMWVRQITPRKREN